MNVNKLNLKVLLEFFDEAPNIIKKGDATSLVSVFGEDIALSLFEHYIKSKGFKFKLISKTCTQGTNKGSRLDAWIEIEDQRNTFYYQTEIKNWSAHAIGGKKISINAKEEELIKHRTERFNAYFTSDNKIKKDGAKKVLIKMKLLSHDESDAKVNKKPLLIYWDAMHPSGKSDPFFSLDIKSKEFSKLYVFSMSNYARELFKKKVRTIEINMPDVDRRIDWMKDILLN